MVKQHGGRTVICVDIGMTGSIARWKHSKRFPQWDYLGSKRKIPTQLGYSSLAVESTKPPISWGTNCANESLDTVKDFKIFFGQPDLGWPAEIRPGAPWAKTDPYKCMQDYLRCFCQDTITGLEICLLQEDGWKEDEVHWSFTVPGSWGPSTIRGFHKLIQEVLNPRFPNSDGLHIHTKVTEAEASLMAMIFGGIGISNPRYSVGKIFLSCDIGGSTTDIAACQMSGTGSLSIVYQTLERLSGAISVQKEFWFHVFKILKRAGVQNAEEVARGVCRQDSSKILDEKLMTWGDVFEFETSTEMGHWSAPDETTIIMGRSLLITRQTVVGFFTTFTEEVENSVSSAQEELESHGVTLDAVGFCGGGSLTSYSIRPISQRISTAGKSNILVVGPQDLTFQPDHATVLGNCIMWDQEELRNVAQNTIFGIERDACIYWKLAEQAIISGDMIGWTVSFDLNTRSRSKTHRLVAISKTSEAPPNTFEIASRSSGFRSWEVKATLSNSTMPGPQSKRNYQICCQLVQDLNVVISCHDRESGNVLSCKASETTEVGGPNNL